MNAKRAPKSAKAVKTAKTTKLFVLDTNVLMHDPTSIFRFEEHDIFVPMMTLEELDANKKGMSEVARNARQASRTLDEIVSDSEESIKLGINLTDASHGLASGHLLLQTEAINSLLPPSLP
ncbi:MAG TPA: ribonuclease, partial [Syntrophobacteraceae bacterium]|nr:ribonuclease [Syntrophobacteraceae bacterium]